MTDAAVIDPLELVDPARYGQRGYPHELWARMRAEAPVAYIEPPDLEPFWAITKHADVQQIAAQPLRFSSARGITLRRPNQPDFHSDVLVVLDPPRHGPLRRVASPRFTPKAMRARRADIERIAVELVDDSGRRRDRRRGRLRRPASPRRSPWPSSPGPSGCRARTSGSCTAGPTR